VAFTTLEDFLERAASRLDPVHGERNLPVGGDLDLVEQRQLKQVRPAAVLVPIIPRETGATVLLTQRPDTMPTHPGQVAFPGGKVDEGDHDEVAAALREAEEEVGVRSSQVDLIGRSGEYFTGTAFRITPVIGVLPRDFEPIPDPTEVAEVFETPLEFLFKRANHKSGTAVWQGRTRHFTEMPWQGFRIWGVTAGIIRVLYETLYQAEES
jgi:8-oxo-dGTP pyrophosphatase MutT (NUDIX family)